MPFHFGRGSSFWQPAPERTPKAPDPLALFPPEPPAEWDPQGGPEPLAAAVPERAAGPLEAQLTWEYQALVDEHLRGRPGAPPAPGSQEIEGLTARLSQACLHVEELASRAEQVLRQAEQVAEENSAQPKSVGLVEPETAGTRHEHRITQTALRRLLTHDTVTRASREIQSWWMGVRLGTTRQVRRSLRHLRAAIRRRRDVLTTVTSVRAQMLMRNAIVVRVPRKSPSSWKRLSVAAASVAVIIAALVLTTIALRRVPRLPSSPPATVPSSLVPAAPVAAPLRQDVSFVPVEPHAATTPVRPAPSTPPHPFVGTLVVESEPSGASVLINQAEVGRTPITLTKLPAKSQVVWVERPGYQRWSAGVPVSAERPTRLNIKLQPELRR